MTFWPKLILLSMCPAVLAFFFGASVLRAQDQLQKEPDGLTRMAATLAGAPRFACTLSTDFRIDAEGMNQHLFSTYRISLERPDRVAFRHQSGLAGASLVSDGKQLYSYTPLFNRYLLEKAPEQVSMLPEISEFWALSVSASLSGVDLIDPLLSDNPAEALRERTEKIEYLGRETLEGLPMYRLRFTQQDLTWDLWVHASGLPVPFRAQPDLSTMQRQMADQRPDMKNVTANLILSFSEWSIGTALPENTFNIIIPETAERVSTAGGLLGNDKAGSKTAVPIEEEFNIKLRLGPD